MKKKTLTVEIHGVGSQNRGAELMAVSIAEWLRETYPEVRIVVSSSYGNYKERQRHDFLTTWEFSGGVRSKITSLAFKYGSPGIKEIFGVVDPRDIDLILDASGFGYSDQWGLENATIMLKKISGGARKDKPLIFMPQAFGPFRNERLHAVSTALFRTAEMVIARDSVSFNEIESLGIPLSLIRVYPDITLGIRPFSNHGLAIPDQYVALVPNIRMIDKGKDSDGYLNSLGFCISKIQEYGKRVIFVCHDSFEDRNVIEKVQNNRNKIPVIECGEPRTLKAILGGAEFVIGSRFHALVGALSQAVPCIGLGWSHKYNELFKDYEIEDFYLKNLGDYAKLTNMIQELVHYSSRKRISEKISSVSRVLIERNQFMWTEIEELIGKRCDFTNS